MPTGVDDRHSRLQLPLRAGLTAGRHHIVRIVEGQARLGTHQGISKSNDVLVARPFYTTEAQVLHL
jgi:hypothetical protein